MTTAMNGDTERAGLMRRLREHVSEGLASRFEHAPIGQLRTMVSDSDEQREFYRLCGFEHVSQEPTKAA